MKGKHMIQKATEAVRENTTSIVRTIVAVVAVVTVLTTSVIVGSMRIQKTESSLANVCDTMTILAETQRRHEDIIDEMRRKQAFQEGVVNTKLDNLEKTVREIKNILSNWESEYAESETKE